MPVYPYLPITWAKAGTQQSEMAQGEDFFQEWLK